MLLLKDFVDKQHLQYCKKEFEDSRHFLKNCGKPEDWYDRFLIEFNKQTTSIFKKYGQ